MATTVPEPQIARYLRWLEQNRGLAFDASTPEGYDALWRWSIDDLAAFWSSIRDYYGVESPTPASAVLAADTMPGARWFPGMQVNYARHVFSHAEASAAAGHPALVFQNEPMAERGEVEEIGWLELRGRVASLAAALVEMGVAPGDRVCAFLPNTPHTIVAFLAVASVGAIWSVCSPDMGPVAVLDRFRQIEPRVLIVCDGSTYGGVGHDRRAVVRQIVEALPSVRDVIGLRYLDVASDFGDLAVPARRVHDFDALVARPDATFAPRWLAFDHPLWVVYSSGTTGLPKAIVHGHGGVMLEALKGGLHNNVGPTAATGDRYHWYSSTGWIMWNSQAGALLGGTTVCIFDGNPGGRAGQPDWTTLWRFAARTSVTFFGAGAAFYASCLKADARPMEVADLSALRAVGSTGSPLAPECYDWVERSLPRVDGRLIWLTAISGGTDFAGAFVAGLPTLPVARGEMQCRCLGAAVEAWSEPDASGRGRPLVDEVGELVCVKPMPSMPLYLWGDFPPASKSDRTAAAVALAAASAWVRTSEADVDAVAADATIAVAASVPADALLGTAPGGEAPHGLEPVAPNASDAKAGGAAPPRVPAFGSPEGPRYHDSYFDMYPGVWRHGDWIRITPRGGAIIYGRSDATINRHGIRMGTSELYRAVETMPEVLDSLVVDLEYLGRESYMPLFVVLREGVTLDAPLRQRIVANIRSALSARHVPNEIFQVDAIPRTLSGKKMELPVKKLLMGTPADQVFKLDAMANAGCVAWFAAFAAERAAKSGSGEATDR
ncbi:acetoacetate--CoA ligase [Piscinibacter koreensis]|uniref:acetoacetate--CoA ligase n=1 Tax=Piscinibacter koreensis TaxID=2742824 RepID=UPI001FE5D9C1|nr:acetoacetate--CoA ligase [Schlegelella koreensis]